MKAVMCEALGAPETLVLRDVPPPAMRARSIRIRVHASGLNFPDVLVVQGKYQVKPALPFSPGAEVAGVVAEVAPDASERFQVGDRVMALPSFGGFAEEVVVDADSAFTMPEGMSFTQAAGFPLTYATTYHALVDRAALAAGEWLLVTGAGGGVGLNAVELGHRLGAKVIAAASTPEKLEAARTYGASELVNYGSEDLVERVKAITGGRGVDVIYDPVGGDVFDAAIRTLGWHGRALVIGFASGRIPEVPANRLLLKEASLVGVFWGSFAARDPAANRRNLDALFDLFRRGLLHPPVMKTYALADGAQAVVDMMERRIVGKAVVVVAP